MTGSHIPVCMSYSVCHCKFSVLTVHVVGTSSRIISQPDAIILNLGHWILLVNLLNFHYLTSCLLDLLELPQEVPEPGFGNDLVLGIDGHSEHRRIWILFTRQLTADYSVLVKRHSNVSIGSRRGCLRYVCINMNMVQDQFDELIPPIRID